MDFTIHIAKMSNQDAIKYLITQPGVKAVKIDNPNGSILPDASLIKIVIEAMPGLYGSPIPGTGTPTAIPTLGLGGS